MKGYCVWQLKTFLNLSIFNWQFSQRFKGFIVEIFFCTALSFLPAFFRRSFWADPLTGDWYTVLFVDMPGSLCLCNRSRSPPPSVRLHPASSLLSLLFIQSVTRNLVLFREDSASSFPPFLSTMASLFSRVFSILSPSLYIFLLLLGFS